MTVQSRKIYVEIVIKIDKEGEIRPLSVTWEDGTVYHVDRLKSKCRAASKKVGGCGVRYTVVIEGKETYLFHEEDKWFVEAKAYV